MRHIDFAENTVPVIRQNNGSHGVQQHFEHRTWTEGCTNNVGDGLGGLDVGNLRLATGLAFCFLVCVGDAVSG